MCTYFLGLKKHDKRLFIFTCEDDAKSADERNLSVRKAQDMFENNILIELFSLGKVVDTREIKFDVTKFWQDIRLEGILNNEDLFVLVVLI